LTATTAEGVTFALSGVDVFGVLASRVTYPVPTEPAGTWTDTHDVRSGVGSTVAAGYITANMGAGALVDRQIGSVSIVDGGVGSAVSWSTRLEPLSQTVSAVCRSTGVVCRATMPTPGVLRYTFTTGRDLSEQRMVGDRGAPAAEFETFRAAPVGSTVIAGGSDVGTSRLFAVATDGATGLDRVETFYDVNNLTTASAVAAAARGALIDRQAQQTVDLAGFDIGVSYLDDFDVGDIIGVDIVSLGERFSAVVDAVAFTVTAESATVLPVLGPIRNDEVTTIMRTLFDTQGLQQGSVA